jgi:putative two-component system response regulator
MLTMDGVAAIPARLAMRGTVMVVDDNPASLTLMEEMLRPRGYHVLSFQMGRMALAAATETVPDLILLDIDMPEMSGYELCERLKSSAQLSEIPVIFVSAMNAPDDRLRGFRSGGIDYVSKPFRIEEMHARLDAHLRLRRFQQETETENCHLQELVEIQVQRIAEGQMETIFAVAKLAEARDDETGRHLEHVQTFCKLLAIGLSEDAQYKAAVTDAWIQKIFHASALHDIGKVAIPDRILLNPGPLTPQEFAVMKTHTVIGAQILRAVHHRYPNNEFTEMGIKIAQSHHERWDGTGYPEGLAGEKIPLCARILAIADCYDALRSRRCYKQAIPHEETSAIILQNSGKHFDPAVTAVFSELADTFRDGWNWLDTPQDHSVET